MNQPNKFRVRVMKGVVEREVEIDTITDLLGMRNIVSVTPVYVEEFDTLTEEEINTTLAVVKKGKERKRKEEEIEQLKEALAAAEAELG